MKDEHGYSIVVGCLVKVNSIGKPWKGWVEALDEATEMLGVVCASRGGMARPVPRSAARVMKPSTFDKARRAGMQNMTSDATRRLRRK